MKNRIRLNGGEPRMDIASRIISLRESKNYTTNKLANLAGISQSHLREIEMGKRSPTVETLSYFCEALGVSLSEFFSDNNEISPFLASALRKLDKQEQEGLAVFINALKKD